MVRINRVGSFTTELLAEEITTTNTNEEEKEDTNNKNSNANTRSIIRGFRRNGTVTTTETRLTDTYTKIITVTMFMATRRAVRTNKVVDSSIEGSRIIIQHSNEIRFGTNISVGDLDGSEVVSRDRVGILESTNSRNSTTMNKDTRIRSGVVMSVNTKDNIRRGISNSLVNDDFINVVFMGREMERIVVTRLKSEVENRAVRDDSVLRVTSTGVIVRITFTMMITRVRTLVITRSENEILSFKVGARNGEIVVTRRELRSTNINGAREEVDSVFSNVTHTRTRESTMTKTHFNRTTVSSTVESEVHIGR